MIRGAIFDLDGTLLDSMSVWETLAENFLRSIGVVPKPDLFDSVSHMNMAEAIDFVRRDYGLAQSAEELEAGVNAILRAFYCEKAPAKPGVPAFLQALRERGVKMAVATASDKLGCEIALQKNGIDQYFSAIVTCAEVGAGKEKPDVYREALKALGTEKENTFVFEDTLYAAQTAARDGFPLVGVYDEAEKKQDELRAISRYFIRDYRAMEGFWTAAGRCVIVGGAGIRDYERARAALMPGDYVVYCDCGLRHREGLGAAPDLIVGDFDSHERPQTETETIVLPREKDDTDTVYAVKEACGRGFDEFLLLGVVGERFDHTFGNISILLMLDDMGKRGVIVDDYSRMELVTDRKAFVDDSCAYFSLLAIGGDARGVTIKNAKYELDRAEITCRYQYGISNECLPGETAEVSVEEGKLLLVRVFRQ